MESVLPQRECAILYGTSPYVHQLVVRISSSESLEGLGHRFPLRPTLEQLMMLHPQPVVMSSEVLSMTFGII